MAKYLNKVRVNVFLDPEDCDFLRERAKLEGSSVSHLMRKLAREYIEKERETLNKKE
jgi:hypothetical protein